MSEVFVKQLVKSDIKKIIENKIKNPAYYIYWKVESVEFAQYAMFVSNRLQVPCVLIFQSEDVYFKTFEIWLTQLQLKILVEPFTSIVRHYSMNFLGNLENSLLVDFEKNLQNNEKIKIAFQSWNSLEKIIEVSFNFLAKSKINDFLGLLSKLIKGK